MKKTEELEKAVQELEKYLADNKIRDPAHRARLEANIGVVLFVLVVIADFFIAAKLPISHENINLAGLIFTAFLIIALFLIIFPIVGKISETLDQKEQKVTQEFLRKNPAYANVFREAGIYFQSDRKKRTACAKQRE